VNTAPAPNEIGPPPFDVAYAAIRTRDARFDGRFYTTVLSTGIYCRPSCPSNTPKPGNVAFVSTAAQAQAAGFRPCLRCFPEALPGPAISPERTSLAGRALERIEAGALDTGSVSDLAAALGTSTRTLNRALLTDTGVSAVQHARSRRARAAFRLLSSTDLDVSRIAFAAGFGSIRTFNETIQQIFARTPGQLRAAARASSMATASVPARLTLNLHARGPVDADRLLHFYAPRTVPGVDRVAHGRYVTAVRLGHGSGVLAMSADAGRHDTLRVCLTLDNTADLTAAIALARRMADLDADGPGIDAALSRLPWLRDDIAAHPGNRLPGEPTMTESLLRAIVTQQVAVASGRAQLRRLVEAVRGVPHGSGTRPGPAAPTARGETEPVSDVGHSARLRPFPTAAQALEHLPAWFRGPAARRETLRQVLGLLAAGEPTDAPGREAALEDISHVKGIGPWTLAYARLRTLGDPDVDLSGDAALLSAARARGLVETRAGLRELLQTARPWRSYAALHLWRGAGRPELRQPTAKDGVHS
jgi:AraC family transcriptional regulator of adaptative response / DNA-3-methyladenine glycosylase II